MSNHSEEDRESCPSCGALPCDWVNDPHNPLDPPDDSRVAILQSKLDQAVKALGFDPDGPCPICSGIEGCSHSLGERVHATRLRSAPESFAENVNKPPEVREPGERAREWVPQIGDEVAVSSAYASWREWQGMRLWIVDIGYHGKNGFDIGVVDEWPPRWDGLRVPAVTDGFPLEHLSLVKPAQAALDGAATKYAEKQWKADMTLAVWNAAKQLGMADDAAYRLMAGVRDEIEQNDADAAIRKLAPAEEGQQDVSCPHDWDMPNVRCQKCGADMFRRNRP